MNLENTQLWMMNNMGRNCTCIRKWLGNCNNEAIYKLYFGKLGWGGRAAEIRCFFPKFQGCTVTCNCQLNDENVSENREAKVSYGKSENKGETE